ncbi:MAG: inner membrane protein [Saprospiraceae bacterium]|jgi:inner membrane protein
MDSLTQIILGAAVGEIVLGKKIGNRALVWGAVGGTIPDLDVIGGMFLSPIAELAAHRGFSHSIVFAIIGAFVFGYGIQAIYESRYYKYIASLGWLLLPIGVLYFLRRFLDIELFGINAIIFVIIIGISGWLLFRRYFSHKPSIPATSAKDWQWLMFWAIFTHPLLDCFTTYGTQLFQPFSDYRVAFCSVSVADPIYTLPFLLCVIGISILSRNNAKRRILAITGIVISSAYLLLGVYNKSQVNTIWKTSLAEAEVDYSRYMTSPTLLNNVLWYCLAETEDGYYFGQYSFWDKEEKVLMEFIPRNQELLNANMEEDEIIKTLRWFSNDYFAITGTEEKGNLSFNDLRFGVSKNRKGERHFIFNFPLVRTNSGSYDITGSNGGPPPGEEQDMLNQLWTRIKGI